MDDSPAERPTLRARIFVALALLLILLVAFWSVLYRHTYGTFDPFAAPEKLTVAAYDRDFFNPSPVMTRAQMLADQPVPPTVVGSTTWFPGVSIGRPAIWGDATASCVTAVYLETAPDQFVRYELSGGC